MGSDSAQSTPRGVSSPFTPDLPEVRRKVKIKPPSQLHRDIEPPPLTMVQRSLNSFVETEMEKPKSTYVMKETEFHDENGRMLIPGSGGGWYAGQVLGGAPHGEGNQRIYYSPKNPDHLLYEGQWKFGRRTGYAWVHYTNGQEYRGELTDGEHDGWGSLRYNNGNIYDGEWLKGRRHGQGTLYYENGNWYDGNWCKDSREGWGIFYWPKIRRKFEGEWACNNPFTGCYSVMQTHEYDQLINRRVEFCPPTRDLLRKGIPSENLELLVLYLRHSFETNYDPLTTIRKVKNRSYPEKLYQTQVERGRCLSLEQLEALKHAYQAIAPGYLRRPPLLAVHLRKLLVIARIDPEFPLGLKLLAHLEQCAKQSSKRNSSDVEALTYSDFLFSIYRFHDP